VERGKKMCYKNDIFYRVLKKSYQKESFNSVLNTLIGIRKDLSLVLKVMIVKRVQEDLKEGNFKINFNRKQFYKFDLIETQKKLCNKVIKALNRGSKYG